MKIGILTMHRVVNYGSALQAYALQHFLSNNGFNNELIDYSFAPRPHGAKDWLRYFLKGNFIKDKKFKNFWNHHYILSRQKYKRPTDLTEATCKYDVYLTGSDQVWNPVHEGKELIFMFNFIRSKEPRKISYACSFSSSMIPSQKKEVYGRLLSMYECISVREENAVSVVKELIGKRAEWVCDPTLLLSSNEWKEIGKVSKITPQKPYVLFYILTYAYNPYPQINQIINRIQEKFRGFHFVFLNGKISDCYRTNSKVINNIGPCDFISLIENAEFVVTTSFHGTAFAINFRKPFYSIIQSNLMLDDRMYSLLKKAGLTHRAIRYDKDFEIEEMDYTSENELRINDFIDNSKKYLLNSLKL